MADEEMVAVILSGSDYESPAFFSEDPEYTRDYLVPRSQLERWKAAKAAYEGMQHEIDQVMEEQRERVRALAAERPKSQLSQWVQDIYGPLVQFQLKQSLEIAKARYEDDTPWLATDSKIDRWEEEQGL